MPHTSLRERLFAWLSAKGLDVSVGEELETLVRGMIDEALDITQLPLDGDELRLLLEPPPRARQESEPPPRDGEPPVRDFDALYEDLGELGRGGMGEVRQVRDRALHRTMVAKLLREDRLNEGDARARFLEEAQITAQLQHVGIVPVHELAQSPDGRPWFTMKEVHGDTFKVFIDQVHAASTGGAWRSTQQGWNFRRLMDSFRRVCDAVAYAHSRGVMHRDIKPSNVMIGSFGEVLVVDWGLAKVGWGEERDAPPPLDIDPVESRRTELNDILDTTTGMIAGTVTYMAPEQARGDHDLVTPRTDVYGLGTMLYQILSGVPPYQGDTWRATWLQVVRGPPAPLSERPRGAWMPKELIDICERAMAREPEDRYPDAGALLANVAEWLEGARKLDEATEVTERAKAMMPQVQGLLDEAGRRRAEAELMQAQVSANAPLSEKEPIWELLAQADQLELSASELQVEIVQLLRTALSHVPELDEPHRLLASYFRRRHEDAESEGRASDAARLERLLRVHDRGEHADYVDGKGALTLLTDPPGAAVTLRPHVERGRRLVLGAPIELGETPLRAAAVPRGSYVARLSLSGYEPVDYPVVIERVGHWSGVAPGAIEPAAVRLLPEGSLGPDDVYVPGGYCWVGRRNPGTIALPWHRTWVEPFIIRRYSLTNREYGRYLDALLAEGQHEELRRRTPWSLRSREDGGGRGLFSVDAEGRHRPVADEDGDVWQTEWPVFRISQEDACAFAAWLSAQDGLPWRLPTELEWEKAARGVDGREYPWGDHFDSAFCNTREAQPGHPFPRPVRAPDFDVSPFGVRGMAGNSADWCGDVFLAQPRLDGSDPAQAVLQGRSTPGVGVARGGAYPLSALSAPAWNRKDLVVDFSKDGLGARLARSLR